MARILKNGQLSGVVSNLVFVQKGTTQYIRSKPAKVKQNAKTKAAASVFGWISAKDKLYRQLLLEKFPLIKDNRYAARHRARMGKTLVTPSLSLPKSNPSVFQNPEALMGFDFNNDFLWTKATQFYPEFSNNSDEVQCKIPLIQWGKQIKAPKNTIEAQLTFEAFSINPNAETMEIVSLSTWTVHLSFGQNQDATDWNFAVPDSATWVLILGKVSFGGGTSVLSLNQKNAATYLWAKNFGEGIV
ncbi:hypothetical protein [Halpernia sp.]|uniref:hypothetical protein n=1 Tax=Halpernia sp. TaxID=2782209 RepID=UPI003A9465E6